MKVDRELLWKAWPEGYLPMRGVSTVGGWLTVAADDDIWPTAVFVGHGRVEVMEVGGPPDREADTPQGRGDLLPNLDPEGDPATFACALRDLATACGFGNAHQWVWELTGGGWTLSRVWVNRYADDAIHTSRAFGMLDIADPIVALAAARAQLREEENG